MKKHILFFILFLSTSTALGAIIKGSDGTVLDLGDSKVAGKVLGGKNVYIPSEITSHIPEGELSIYDPYLYQTAAAYQPWSEKAMYALINSSYNTIGITISVIGILITMYILFKNPPLNTNKI